MSIVIVESPYAGDIERNVKYAQDCCKDCVKRGENPFASHLLYTQFLDDSDPHERELGIALGFEFRKFASRTVVYTDLGISPGMELGIQSSESLGIEIEYRTLKEWGNDNGR